MSGNDFYIGKYIKPRRIERYIKEKKIWRFYFFMMKNGNGAGLFILYELLEFTILYVLASIFLVRDDDGVLIAIFYATI